MNPYIPNKLITLSDKLAHLTTEEINELIYRYYTGAQQTELIKNFNLKVSSKIYEFFPPEMVNEKCEYCNEFLFIKRQSRSEINSRWYRPSTPCCLLCGHTNTFQCHCLRCYEIKKENEIRENERKKQAIIQRYLAVDSTAVSIERLTLRQILFLCSLLRVGLDEDFFRIRPGSENVDLLSPTKSYTKSMLEELYNSGLILVHPSSSINAFEELDFPNVFDYTKVYYQLNVTDSSSDPKKMIELLLNPRTDQFITDLLYCYDLWSEVALEECKQYFLSEMEKVGFDFSIGEKTILVFKDLLHNFSVSQIFGIIYSSITYATRLLQEKTLTKKHAANSVVTFCQRRGEKAIAEKWDLRSYHRNYHLPQTMVSQVLFNRILKIGDRGFYQKPNVNIIQEMLEEIE
jgi:hypothetical protein